MTSTISKIPFLVGQRVKHVKTGNIYTIIRHARDELTLEWLVIYEGSSGDCWARNYEQMHDGRFVLFDKEKE